MRNMWGEKLNHRDKLTLFICLSAIFSSIAIIVPVLYFNWQSIKTYVVLTYEQIVRIIKKEEIPSTNEDVLENPTVPGTEQTKDESDNQNNSNNNENIILTEEQKKFNELFEKVQKLEELSKAYDSESHETRFLAYLRSGAYNSSSWSLLLGTSDSSFETYVEENQGEYNLTDFINNRPNEQLSFIIPSTNEEVDFYHLFAVLNAVHLSNKSVYDTLGWGGDLVQLMNSFKNTTLTGDSLLSSVKTAFNGDSKYGFGSADVCADFDAVNIIENYKNSEYSSLTECIVAYYNSITTEKRVKDFTKTTFETNYSSSDIMTRLTNNFLINRLAEQTYNFTLSDTNEFCTACVQAFSDYLTTKNQNLNE